MLSLAKLTYLEGSHRDRFFKSELVNAMAVNIADEEVVARVVVVMVTGGMFLLRHCQ